MIHIKIISFSTLNTRASNFKLVHQFFFRLLRIVFNRSRIFNWWSSPLTIILSLSRSDRSPISAGWSSSLTIAYMLWWKYFLLCNIILQLYYFILLFYYTLLLYDSESWSTTNQCCRNRYLPPRKWSLSS